MATTERSISHDVLLAWSCLTHQVPTTKTVMLFPGLYPTCCHAWADPTAAWAWSSARQETKKDTSVSVHSTWLAYMHHRGPLLPGGLWNKLNSHQPGPSGLYELDSSWKLLKQISDSDYKHYKKWKTQNKSVIFNCKSVYKRRLCVTKQPPISICRHETKIPHLLLSFPFICEGVKIF